jgi:hypothetical protein
VGTGAEGVLLVECEVSANQDGAIPLLVAAFEPLKAIGWACAGAWPPIVLPTSQEIGILGPPSPTFGLSRVLVRDRDGQIVWDARASWLRDFGLEPRRWRERRNLDIGRTLHLNDTAERFTFDRFTDESSTTDQTRAIVAWLPFSVESGHRWATLAGLLTWETSFAVSRQQPITATTLLETLITFTTKIGGVMIFPWTKDNEMNWLCLGAIAPIERAAAALDGTARRQSDAISINRIADIAGQVQW